MVFWLKFKYLNNKILKLKIDRLREFYNNRLNTRKNLLSKDCYLKIPKGLEKAFFHL